MKEGCSLLIFFPNEIQAKIPLTIPTKILLIVQRSKRLSVAVTSFRVIGKYSCITNRDPFIENFYKIVDTYH